MKRIISAFAVCLLVSVACLAQSARTVFTASSAGGGSGTILAASGTLYHQVIWTVSGTVTSCTVAIDSSADGITWTAGGVVAGQTCTANGNSSIVNANVNWVRINFTALAGGGTVTAVYNGWVTNPSGSAAASSVNPRFDLQFATPPSIPSVGGPLGAGNAVVDSLAGLTIHRLTDWLFTAPRAASCGSFKDCSEFGIGPGGSAEKRAISYDGTRVIMTDNGGDGIPVAFDPVALTMTPIPPSGETAATELPSGCIFSEVADYRCYLISYSGGGGSGHPLLSYYDLSNATQTAAWTKTDIYDIGADTNCFPSGYAINSTNSATMDVSSDGTVFAIAPGSAGQGSAGIVEIIKPSLGQGSGCRYWQTGNTGFGAVAGSWGTTGTNTDTDEFLVHNVVFPQGANPSYVRIDYGTCQVTTTTCPASANGNALWTFGGLAAVGQGKGGHLATGQTLDVDDVADCAPTCQMWSTHLLTAWQTFTHLTNASYLPPNHTGWDYHISYVNANATDSNPWAGSTFVTNVGVPTTPGVWNNAWDGEVIQGLMDGSGRVARYAHTNCVYDTTAAFDAYDCVGQQDPKGRFFLWTSAWGNTLGQRAQNISSWSRTTNVVTVTTSAAFTGAVNDTVQVYNAATGTGATKINGTWTVTGVSGSTFTFAQTAANDSSATAQGAVDDSNCSATCRADVFAVALNPSPTHP